MPNSALYAGPEEESPHVFCDAYRSLFYDAPIGYAELDRDGTFVRVNSFFCRMLDYLPEELVGRPFWEFMTPGDRQVSRDAYQHKMNREQPLVALERHYLRRSGEVLLLRIHHNFLTDAEGEITGVRAAIIDLTQHQHYQEQLVRQKAELERSNAELQQFAYVASHDLQEPLRMVASYTQLLARRYNGRLDADADEFIAFAVDGANRMQRLINDLLAYSRLGSRAPEIRAVEAKTVLETALQNLRVAVAESRALISTEPLPTVLADTVQLVQVFQNLIGNALKFRDGNEPVVSVGAVPENGFCRFWVRDNGIGIDPRHASRIFQVFQRLHSRSEYPGTGIGLAICKKIVERHGGRIWVESEPGKGATFLFTVPLAAEGNRT